MRSLPAPSADVRVVVPYTTTGNTGQQVERDSRVRAVCPEPCQTSSTPSPVCGACNGWANTSWQMRQQHRDCAVRVVRLADYIAHRAASNNIATALTRFNERDVIAVGVSRTGTKAQRGMAGIWEELAQRRSCVCRFDDIHDEAESIVVCFPSSA